MSLPKILYVTNSFYPPQGGAERCMRTLLEEISLEYRCFVVTGGAGDAIKLGPILCSFVQKSEQIKKKMMQIDPDIVLTLGPLVSLVTTAAKQMGKPVVVHILDYSNFCPCPVRMKTCNKLCDKCAYYNRSKEFFIKTREALMRADKIICVTNYMRRALKDFYGLQSQRGAFLFIRCSDFTTLRAARQYSQIGMVKFMAHKGATIFVQIALKMPQVKFIAAGRSDLKISIEGISNLSYIGNIPPKKFYSRIDILLIPSIWPEPAGRVILEAMANRIPVIASNVGGIAEVMDGAGILIEDYMNPGAWIKRIKLLLEDKEYYMRIANEGWQRSQRYSLEKTVVATKGILRSLLDKTGGSA